jgi:ribosome-associated toxin RatA of RatAB toxin-antitoxin module
MAEIQKTISMNVPVEEAFNFVANTHNLVEVWPSLSQVRDWKRDERGIGEFGYTYQMAGFKYNGTNRDREFVRNKRIVTESQGGLQAIITWEFEPISGGTQVTFKGEYNVSIPLFGNMIAERIAALNAIEVEALLKNIKKKLEK